MKKFGIKGLVAVLAAVVLLGGVTVYAMGGKEKGLDNAGSPVAKAAPAPAAEATVDMTFDNASLPKEPMGVRTLGDPAAKVKIEEFASLTCPHCADFERTTFPQLKKKYIDTGKVFYVFTDFPLNAPALDAAMIARCLPAERYFPYIVMLFGSQDEWAFGPEYKTNLLQTAKLAGLNDAQVNACLADKNLKEGIIKSMQRAQGEGVNSTPTFNINGTIIKGALGIEAFDKAIADAMKKTTEEKTTGKKE